MKAIVITFLMAVVLVGSVRLHYLFIRQATEDLAPLSALPDNLNSRLEKLETDVFELREKCGHR